MRAGRSAGLVLAAASLLLAGCGSPAATSSIAGQPSLDISVPLALAGCDGQNTCYALGTTGFGGAAGQVSTKGSQWSSTAIPAATDTILTSMSCWGGGCLFGGTNGTDVIWAAHGAAVTAVGAPSGGRGIVAVSCFATASCAAIDTDADADGASRFTETTDGGATWSTPLTVPDPTGDPILSLACLSALSCVVSINRHVNAYAIATADGGHTWGTIQDATGYSKLTDVTCSDTSCVALADANGPAQVYTSTSSTPNGLGLTWAPATHQPSGTLAAVACARNGRCVAVGGNGHGGAWLATSTTKGHWTTQALRYVADPLTAVGCGTTRCVATNASSTVIVTP